MKQKKTFFQVSGVLKLWSPENLVIQRSGNSVSKLNQGTFQPLIERNFAHVIKYERQTSKSTPKASKTSAAPLMTRRSESEPIIIATLGVTASNKMNWDNMN